MEENSVLAIETRRKEIQAYLLSRVRDTPQSIDSLAKEIGISYLTLRKFLQGSDRTSFLTLCRIEKYLRSTGALQ